MPISKSVATSDHGFFRGLDFDVLQNRLGAAGGGDGGGGLEGREELFSIAREFHDGQPPSWLGWEESLLLKKFL